MDPTTLHASDREFLAWIAGHLSITPGDALGRLLDGAGDGPVSTRVEDGRIVALDLRAIGREIRWAIGDDAELKVPTRLLDACRELDCSGLGLDRLHTEPMAGLRVLECSDNRLVELDVAPLRQLKWLAVAGNRLMVLDLRRCHDIRHVDCTGNQLAVLMVPELSGLTVLRCGRNQLMGLEVGNQPVLRELAAARNALVRIEVGDCPELEVLDCSTNELQHLGLTTALPSLATLSCGDNSLAALPIDLLPGLRRLSAPRNYLAALDLRECPHVEQVVVEKNQLEALHVTGPSVRELACGDNRLTSIELGGCPALEVLRVNDNELATLDLAGMPALVALDARCNRLRAIDLSGAPRLAWLDLRKNPLDFVDLEAHRDLFAVEIDRGIPVGCTPAQHDLWFSPSIPKPFQGATAGQLHRFVRTWTGPAADRVFLDVVRSPKCDLGTALYAYWTSSPHHFLQYASRDEIAAWEQDTWDLLAAVEERLADGGFATSAIPFDPRADRQARGLKLHDWTEAPPGIEAVREIPEGLYRRSGG